MKPSDDLYQLIQSLSSSEKRYIKLHSGIQKGEKFYMKLFDAMAQQKEYNEAALLKKFAHDTFVKNFSVSKKYLYNQILKSLKSFSTYQDEANQVYELIEKIKILREKGLYDQSYRLLKQAKKIAIESELFLQLLDILQLERRQVLLRSEKDLKKQTEAILEEQLCVKKQLDKVIEVEKVWSEVNIWLRTYRNVRHKEAADSLDAIVAPILNQKPEDMLSNQAKRYYWSALADYYSLIENHKKSMEYMRQFMLGMLEAFRKNPYNQMIGLYNYLSKCASVNYYEDFDHYLEVMKNLPAKTPRLKVAIFERWLQLKLRYLNTSGQFEEGSKVIKEAMPKIKQYNKILTKKVMIPTYYWCGLIEFGAGHYDKALVWVDKVIDQPPTMVFAYSLSKMLHLVLHYELGNTELLDSIIRSTYRYLYTKEMFKSEQIMLQHMKKIQSVYQKKELKKAFLELKEQLQLSLQDSAEQPFYSYLHIICWLDSKIKNQSYQKLVQEKYETFVTL